MAAIVEKGINSFKFFMAYKGALMVGDELLLDGMQRCKELGALAMVCLLPMENKCCQYLCLMHSALACPCFPAFMSMSCNLAESSYHLAICNCVVFAVKTERLIFLCSHKFIIVSAADQHTLLLFLYRGIATPTKAVTVEQCVCVPSMAKVGCAGSWREWGCHCAGTEDHL